MLVVPSTGMALPVVKTLQDCADWDKTVAPFIGQLYDLPQNLLAARTIGDLKNLYVATNPLISAVAFALLFAQIVFIVSEINKNYSQVDRCWSLLPTAFNLHYWYWARINGIHSQKLDALIAFSCIWSARLTFNYWRKGGYSVGSEDYRWEIVKTWMNKPLWVVFNAVFISVYQALLLLAITTPSYLLVLTSRIKGYKASTEDTLFSVLLVTFVLIEFIADNQQWTYHAAKKSYQDTAKVPAGWEQRELDRGFNTRGLFRYSRHPNFAGEQAVWVTLYQWGCFETNTMLNWTFIGAINYLMLFQGSTWLTESITSKKYPEYAAYKEYVGQFVPRLTGASWDDYVNGRTNSDEKADTKKTK